MLASEYDVFVHQTDLKRDEALEKRREISIYGLVGEIGALTAAAKRRLLAESDGARWDTATDEIREELGDTLWYWSNIIQIEGWASVDVLKHDFQNLREHLKQDDEKAELFRSSIGKERQDQFLDKSIKLENLHDFRLSDYQGIAILTKRTDGQTFLGVCVTVLAQLGAELLRINFPDVEVAINTVIERRQVKTILGEMAWHISAVASTFGLSLDEVAAGNKAKINSRLDTSTGSPSLDGPYEPHEQFPRAFDVSFIMVGPDRSRMYLNGRQLGDELTDNSYVEDGYRFHDVMHLSNVATLGWSPVLRSLLKRKRKSNPKTDEVEDGARAQIVEEAVIKAIHSEGQRVAGYRGDHGLLFKAKGEISFEFLSFLRTLTKNLEVQNHYYWEWVEAIMQGSEVFCALRNEEQGTVHVDLDARRIEFSPDVYIDGPGTVVGAGVASVEIEPYGVERRSSLDGLEWAGEAAALGAAGDEEIAAAVATKRAIINACGLSWSEDTYGNLRIRPFGAGISVKATGEVRAAMWRRKIIGFKTTVARMGGAVSCTALAVVDPADAAR